MAQILATTSTGYIAHSVPSDTGDTARERLINAATACLSAFGLFVILLTLTPFQGASFAETTPSADGNIVNQVGYLSLGAIYLFSMLAFVDRRVLISAISPSWFIIIAIAFWAAQRAYLPDAATRGVLLTLIATIPVAGVVLLPRRERDFVNAAANAVLLLILIDYAALVIIPDAAIHTAAGGEPWHAGSWRGHLMHKNYAAPIFSVLAMFGIYCWRSGLRWRGPAITLLAIIFVLHTQSKTTIGFLPLAIMTVFLTRATGRPLFTVAVHMLLFMAIGMLTIGTVIFPRMVPITKAIIEDSTFTGRDEIWIFGIQNLMKQPWTGFGTFSFWLTPVVARQEPNYEASWDVRGIVSGHNSYLDAFLYFGIPAGLVVILILTLKPMRDYCRAYKHPENRHLADFFMMVVVLMTYVGMLEAFILARADPLWMMFVLGVFGLSMLSRRTVRN
ncbi:O-antigen ligase [Pararhizobium capsulatum DSM 1112]|uniref:O-antigen ligase n=1 Tax=Pararhizobium capsulatum DSM 1112 TaxID=1121113 RepID=A0ABU0BR11_9HYPH|nr:O-antigen ligase [Pararhizobium capsulatum]MDQ0320688.1 O-antigen ligase [Pararhizobium capsulatum DSM 1112]